MSYWKGGKTFVILCCITLVFTNDVYIKIKKIECTANERHIENVTCTLKPINWTRSVLNMDCDIIGSLENVSMRIDLFYRDFMHLYKPFGLHLEYNVCRLIGSGKPLNFLERYSLLHFLSLTNVNHSCPYMGHIYARNFYLDDLTLPHIPLQEYKISFNFTDLNPMRFLGALVLHFEVCEDYYGKRKRVKPKPVNEKIVINGYL